MIIVVMRCTTVCEHERRACGVDGATLEINVAKMFVFILSELILDAVSNT